MLAKKIVRLEKSAAWNEYFDNGVRKMKNLILGILMISVLLLAGCSTQTVVKYQCADGSFVDSADSCPAVECQANCPELDCDSCPPKIEYVEEIVEKPVEVIYADACSAVECQANCPELDCDSCPPKIEYVEEIVEKPVEVIKYQCYDGTFETSKSECESPEEAELDSFEEEKHGEIIIQRVQVQLANLYPARVTVENTGDERLTPKFDVLVKKDGSTVCEGSPMIDDFDSIEPGESETGEFTIMGCMFESDGQYTLTVDLLDSDYNRLDSDSEDFTVDYWSQFT